MTQNRRYLAGAMPDAGEATLAHPAMLGLYPAFATPDAAATQSRRPTAKPLHGPATRPRVCCPGDWAGLPVSRCDGMGHGGAKVPGRYCSPGGWEGAYWR